VIHSDSAELWLFIFNQSKLGYLIAARREQTARLQAVTAALKRNDFWLNRYFALACCLSMISSENRHPLFGIML